MGSLTVDWGLSAKLCRSRRGEGRELIKMLPTRKRCVKRDVDADFGFERRYGFFCTTTGDRVSAN